MEEEDMVRTDENEKQERRKKRKGKNIEKEDNR